jgi:glycosyltransferase involved in cell wall biosynthesis
MPTARPGVTPDVRGGMTLADVRSKPRFDRCAVKIALISAHASPLLGTADGAGGAQHAYVAQLARALGSAGHQVDVFTRRDDLWSAPVVPFAPNAALVHVPAGPPRAVRAEVLAPYLDEFAARVIRHCAPSYGRYDVAHANCCMSGLAALRLKERFGTPFVVTFHALGRALRRDAARADAFLDERIRIEERVIAKADRLIAGSPDDRGDLVDMYAADARRIDVVPCGFDPTELGPGAKSVRARLGLRSDEFVVLHVGVLAPGAGVENAIDALARLKRARRIRARLVVVGGDAAEPDPWRTPDIARLAATAATEGVAGQVTFTGRRARGALRDYYCAADVCVATPAYAPFGVAALEAMACGLPVIGAAVGGIRHTVVDAVTGYLVPPADPAALAERLARFHDNRELGRAYGRAGIMRARRAFTSQQAATRLARVYAATLAPLGAPLASAASAS